MTMKLKFLGGAREVGKSGIKLSEKDTNILLDYGMKVDEPPKYPLSAGKINYAIPTHAHLDHSGSMPSLFRRGNPEIITNDVSLELIKLLLNDSLKIARIEKYKTPFKKRELTKMISNTNLLKYKERFQAGRFKCELYDAGHIPGSSSVLLESSEKRVFYTGDINFKETNLLHGCVLPDKTDILITESTYGKKDHPPRAKEENKFRTRIEETIANNGTALVPVFAVGRAQEILLVLEKYKDQIALDGMAKTASDIIMSYGEYLKDSKRLESVLDEIFWIRDNNDRDIALKRYPIIVSTAGMLGGGPAIYFLKKIHENPEAKILFTGFLVEDSPGRNLLQTGNFSNDEDKFSVKCQTEQFDFSSHAGKKELFKIIKKTSPEHVVCVHGDSCQEFAKDVKEKFGVDTYAPEIGQTLEFE